MTKHHLYDISLTLELMYLLFHTLPIRQAAQMQLFAANGAAIPTYGKRLLKLDLGLRREFNWLFIIAAVSQPIIGTPYAGNFSSVKATIENSKFHQLLSEFSTLKGASTTPNKIVHGVEHWIQTNGPPVFSKPRRLPADKLKAAKQEFEFLVASGVCRPSKSCWIPVRKEDVPKTAITTPFGLFEFLFMPFGLLNSATTFQRFKGITPLPHQKESLHSQTKINIATIETPSHIDFQKMANNQNSDKELSEILAHPDKSPLVLQPFPMGDPAIELHCDVASNRIRPFVPEVDRKRYFLVCILFHILGLRLLSNWWKNDTYGLE
ncbi:reverse transcriptase [Caerostris extrusa]|uniref:Reverse transcriptase n=1 Tax=Caerostris extrusa TaxID=172846 RepID=A0AAV4WVI4_CAEEX|nr:reverse transcriptase [Caerostris extrusa]